MDDLVKRLKAKRNRPMVKKDLGNGQAIISPTLYCFVEEDKLRAEAASEIERLEQRVKELEEALNSFVTEFCEREGEDDYPLPAKEQSCENVRNAMWILEGHSIDDLTTNKDSK